MKIIPLFIIFLAFTFFKVIYANSEDEVDDIVFPTLETPNITFLTLDTGCGGTFECIRFIGQVLYNIGAGLIYLVLFFINLLVFFFRLFALLLATAFTPIGNAPWWMNGLLIAGLMGSLTVIIFKMIRKGSSEN